ncbi:MAG: carbohydrate ABC transporter substrate-binding protein [Bacilli bacterium]
MKKSVKLLVMGVAALGMLGSVVSCGDSGTECPVCPDDGGTTSTGKVLNIWAWNNEFQNRFRAYYTGYVKTEGDYDILRDGTKVKWTIHANDNNGYQIPLDEALLNQDSAADDDKIDMFLSEADYILKYSNSDYTLDVEKDIGLTDDDLSEQYQYTKDIASVNGALKGTTWQATPGLYAFRSDIAEEVLGTSDPTKVQAMISTWDGFNAVAKKMKDKGYKMLSGYDDSYRVYSNNTSAPWVTDGKVSIDNNIKKWADDTKTYVDSGYCGDTTLWSGAWGKDQGPEGKVFGFFYSTWGINFTLAGNSLADATAPAALGNGLYGKYRVCEGPASWYWGGTWIHGCKGTDNVSQIKDIMKDLTCTRSVANSITRIEQDYTNHQTAMESIAADESYGSSFLGGQNHIALFTKNASKISMKNMTAYDQGCNEKFQNAMHDYFAGTATYNEALANFKTAVTALYPELTYNF